MLRRDWQRKLVIAVAVTASVVMGSELAAAGWSAWRGGDSASPSSWLREADQEQLADSVSTAAERYGWPAGCLWPSDDGQSRMEAVGQLGFERDDLWVLSARHLKSGALLMLLRHPGIFAGYFESPAGTKRASAGRPTNGRAGRGGMTPSRIASVCRPRIVKPPVRS